LWLKQPVVDSNNCLMPAGLGSVWLFFFFVSKMKSELSGLHFRSNSDAIHDVEAHLQALHASFFQEKIGTLEHRWTKFTEVKRLLWKRIHESSFSCCPFLVRSRTFWLPLITVTVYIDVASELWVGLSMWHCAYV
jgi:hypothetical protein